MTTRISIEWGLPLEEVAQWPAKKKLLYIISLGSLREQEREASGYDDMQDMQGVDPENMTREQREQLMRQGQNNSSNESTDATVDNKRITRSEQSDDDSKQLFRSRDANSLHDVHPALRGYSNIVRTDLTDDE